MCVYIYIYIQPKQLPDRCDHGLGEGLVGRLYVADDARLLFVDQNADHSLAGRHAVAEHIFRPHAHVNYVVLGPEERVKNVGVEADNILVPSTGRLRVGDVLGPSDQ